MKVWVVTAEFDNETAVIGVFTNLALAGRCIVNDINYCHSKYPFSIYYDRLIEYSSSGNHNLFWAFKSNECYFDIERVEINKD